MIMYVYIELSVIMSYTFIYVCTYMFLCNYNAFLLIESFCWIVSNTRNYSSSTLIERGRTKDFSRQNLPGEMLWFRCLVPKV